MKKSKGLTNSVCIFSFLLVCSVVPASAQDFLEDIRAKMKANGWPTSLEELNEWYVTPPEGENGAELVLQAISSINSSDIEARDIISTPGNSGFPDLRERPETEVLSESEAFFEQNRTAFEKLSSALKMENFKYPFDASEGILRLRLSHLSPIRKTASLLRLKAVVGTVNGDFEQAGSAIEDMLLLANSLKQEPFLISQLLQIAGINQSVTTVEWMLNDSEITENLLAGLYDSFFRYPEENLMTRGFIGELVHTIEYLKVPESDLTEALFLWEGSLPRPAELLQSPEGYGIISRYFDFQSQLIVFSRESYPASMSGYQALSRKIEELDNEPNVLIDFFGSASWKTFVRQGRTVANMRLAKTAIAVERFRLGHGGAVPNSLEELVPNYLPEIPTDPFDGNPLRFFVTDESSYKIYSIADDFRDDGGTNRRVSDDGFDIIFEVQR